MARKINSEKPLDELSAFVYSVYGLLDIDRATTIKTTIKNVRGNKIALKAFVQNALTCATMLDKSITDIELGTILFRVLLEREITGSELSNMIEYLDNHTRTDMINKLLASAEWAERVNRIV